MPLAPLILVLPALHLVGAGLLDGEVVGLPWGEVWGRMFVTGQVARWFGEAPFGWADLLAAPEGRPFWPTDPLLQAVAVPLRALFGDVGSWALQLALLSLLAGLGGYAAARATGAGIAGALAAGLVLQWNPFLLRNAAEGVTEVLALGPPALAVAAAAGVLRGGTRGAWLAFAGAVALTAGTSPYYALYGAVALGVSLPLWPQRSRPTALRLLGLVALVGALFALPLLLTEAGPGGRLSSTWTGGYGLQPDALVVVQEDGTLNRDRPPRMGPPDSLGRGSPSRLHQGLVQWPGGLAVTLLLVAGLRWRHTRRIAAFGLAWLVLGPAWAVVGRWLGHPEATGPIAWLLLQLPGTAVLGNANRLVVVPVVCAALAAGPLAARLPGAALVALLALAAGVLEAPPLRMPGVEVDPPDALWSAIEGPTATWPDADPPAWNPGPFPKEDLWLATRHGGPQAFDYGRGGTPVDAPLLVRLSQVARVPVSRRAALELLPEEDASMWATLRANDFQRVLVLYRTLDADQRERARAWLTDQLGPPVAETVGGGVWAIGAR